jgi:DNA-binding CsgD family transcriptional regulator/PAS domain-containing protein
MAIDPTPDWVGTLDALARHVGGTHGQIFAGRLSEGRASTAELSGVDPQDVASYLQEHGTNDPRVGAILANVGRVVRGSDLEPPNFDAHPIVRDYLDRFGLRRHVALALSPDGDQLTNLTVIRSRRAGSFNDAEVVRFGQVARHVMRAHVLQGALAQVSALPTSLAAHLDASQHATVLVDARGRVVFLNLAAEDLFRRGVLTARGGPLSVGDDAVQGRFAAELAAARWLGVRAPPDGAVVVLHCDDATSPSGFRRDAAQITALSPNHPYRAVAPRAVVCIRVARLDAAEGGAPTVDPEVLAGVFDLTPREARLAAFVGAGGSLDAACRVFGVSRNTARVQLQAVFEKTGTRRQPELVRLVQRLASLRW